MCVSFHWLLLPGFFHSSSSALRGSESVPQDSWRSPQPGCPQGPVYMGRDSRQPTARVDLLWTLGLPSAESWDTHWSRSLRMNQRTSWASFFLSCEAGVGLHSQFLSLKDRKNLRLGCHEAPVNGERLSPGPGSNAVGVWALREGHGELSLSLSPGDSHWVSQLAVSLMTPSL